MRALSLLSVVAFVGCTGQTAAVLVDHELPDGQADASADGPSPTPDSAQEHAGDAGADVYTTPEHDAGGDEQFEAQADVVDEILEDGTASEADAPDDGGLRCDQDAGFCQQPDGAICYLPATDFGCTLDQNPVCTDSQYAAYDCATPPPTCYAEGAGRYCCLDEMLCPAQ